LTATKEFFEIDFQLKKVAAQINPV